MSEWKSIESAPKDGTQFLIWDQGFIAVGFYMPNGNYRAVNPVTLHVLAQPHMRCAAGSWCRPTHWQPRPEAPHVD